MIKHVAKYGRVWKRLKDGAMLGNEISLKDGEKISAYMQVYAPPKEKEPPKKEKQTNRTPFGATEV